MKRKHDFAGNLSRCIRCGCARVDAEDIGGPECIPESEVRDKREAEKLGHVLARLRREANR